MGFGNWSTPGSNQNLNHSWENVGFFFNKNNADRGGGRSFTRPSMDSPDFKKRVEAYDPREYGEKKMASHAMYRTAVFDTSVQIGSNSGYKWQPVSDLEWVRLFERYWFNKRVTMSHSDSYIFESNPGKPKMVRKGQGKNRRAGGGANVAVASVHGRKPHTNRAAVKMDDRKHMKRQ